MVLPLLGQDWDNIRGYSWGSVVLAWLYRQLCDAVGGVDGTRTLVDALTSYRFGFGSVF
jgi:hypothetical protein